MVREARVKVRKDGSLSIPADMRRALGVTKGDEFRLTCKDSELRLTTMKTLIERAQRHARQYVKPGVSLVEELIAERRQAAKKE
jgi:bifunctional DNA-binding transcriptional regulator/antitoxin component of YhaV-PrlF toxin-antitoxin module